jgi:cell division protein ZapE
LAIETSGFLSLTQVRPEANVLELLADLVPPREFQQAKFSTYKPSSEFPSQAKALDAAKSFTSGTGLRKIFGKTQVQAPGIYLDGGFGVGKTHLLAAVWHEFKGKKAFGSFIAFTSLIGALGFKQALEALSKFELICIDEFELDDPGDTMMMSRLLNELAPLGVRFAATSNTPPNALGEGRFAASDFTREIHGIADRFEIIRIEGEDYRHRPLSFDFKNQTDEDLTDWLSTKSKVSTAVDEFSDLLKHLSTIHPSGYGKMLAGVSHLAIRDVRKLENQVDALRFVAFVDRAYESQLSMTGSGLALTDVFSQEYLSGGYRKKYLRAVSRLGAMMS